MYIRPFFFTFLLSYLGLSCATRTVSIGTKTVSPLQVHQTVRANQERMGSAVGGGTITIESPSVAQSGSFTLLLRKPDTLLVRLKGPFGIKLASALLTRKDFQFYNSLENRLFSGETNARNLARILRVNLDFADLLNLFTGGVFQEEDSGLPDESGVEDENFLFVYRVKNGTHKYLIDPQTLLIAKVQHVDVEGRLVFEQRFLNFQIVDGTVIPFNIRIIQPRERRMVSVVYSDVALNKQDLDFTFTYPRNAERVRWQ